MAERSKIEWCDATFNPWIGCTNVSPGCDHCYAEQQDKFRGWTSAGWGAGKPRRRTSEKLWAEPVKWNGQPFYECASCGWRGTSKEWERGGCCSTDNLTFARRRVFCASLADVFDNEVDYTWRFDLFALIMATPNLDWLLLTKRMGNVRNMVEPIMWPHLPNVWLGATIVNQEEADRDIPKLLATPARVRFLSMEPLLGSVDIRDFLAPEYPSCKGFAQGQSMEPGYCGRCGGHASDPIHVSPGKPLDWVIVGGESGPKARPMHPDWARSLRDQCAAAGVPFLFKQWGEWTEIDTGMAEPLVARVGDPEFDDSAAQHDAFLSIDGHFVEKVEDMHDDVPYRGLVRVGKKAAGRLLDGVTHDGFPEVRA